MAFNDSTDANESSLGDTRNTSPDGGTKDQVWAFQNLLGFFFFFRLMGGGISEEKIYHACDVVGGWLRGSDRPLSGRSSKAAGENNQST